MAEFEVFRLRPRGAFHFGTQGVGLEAATEHCPSDTLYAALLIEALQAGEPLAQLISGELAKNPPFRISSCFPYAEDALLFPLPRLKSSQETEHKPGQRKRMKKLRYISATILRDLLQGGVLTSYHPEKGGSGSLYQDDTVLIAAEDSVSLAKSQLWQSAPVEHVTVDRAHESSEYYLVSQIRYAPDCGLFVLAQTHDTTGSHQLFELLTRLSHSGLGGRRSSGLGQFDVSPPTSIDLPTTSGCERAMLLSRYLPSLRELQDNVLGSEATYDLMRVGGWLQTHSGPSQRRKNVQFLAEGSIVQCKDKQPPNGDVANVAPSGGHGNHPVYRHGLALTVGVTAQEDV